MLRSMYSICVVIIKPQESCPLNALKQHTVEHSGLSPRGQYFPFVVEKDAQTSDSVIANNMAAQPLSPLLAGQ